MIKKIIIVLFGLINICTLINSKSQLSAEDILKEVDNKRAPAKSFSSIINIITTENEEVIEKNQMKILTKIKGNGENRSIGVILKPENQKNRKILLIGTDTWLYIPGAEKSIKISSAQKLSGNASTGDIMSVNYQADYEPEITGEKEINNISCYELKLSAKSSRVTYYKIIMYVDKIKLRPVKNEYYSKSDKLIKTGYFRKFKNFGGKELCSEVIIVDNIMNDRITLVQYSNYNVENISESYFNQDLLKDLDL